MLKNRFLSWLTITILSFTLWGCNDTIDSVQAFNAEAKPPIPKVENIAEVAPPTLITQLNEIFSQTKPQVKILSPQNGEILNTNNISVTLEVKGLEIFKNEELKMGPHLHFFIDNQPYQAVYDTAESIELKDLSPGTHTIRVFASRPWDESFKNEGAYAQTTFHVFTPTEDNNPDEKLPLLTYNSPQGVYSAEPIMLDFYLTNAPLHAVANENPNDNISDWRIRVTINGESFLLDTWQPIYLTGFKKGQNWIKLEFIDDNGNVIKNAFNSTVRVINFDPKTKDTLAKLVTNKISLAKAQAITSKNTPVIPEQEEIEETPQEEISPEITSIPEVTDIPQNPPIPEVTEKDEIMTENTVIEPIINEATKIEDHSHQEKSMDTENSIVEPENSKVSP